MNIHLIAVGSKMPGWIEQGFQEYTKRMPHELNVKLIEIPLEKRSKTSSIEKLKVREGEKILAAIPNHTQVVALEVKGQAWSTEQLSNELTQWKQGGQDIALLIGGPDGLSDACRAKANTLWSLSPLTLPHPIVRVVIAEQLYRAWTISNNHPYHR